MREVEYISVPEAIEIARELGISVTTPTATKWIRMHRLGHQPGGTFASPAGDKRSRWLVSRKRWINFIMGRK